MYTVGVADFVMIAHSLRGEVFGPAQRRHGATLEVRAELRAPTLDGDGIVFGMGQLHDALSQALAPLAYRDLDELDLFGGRNSTTEVLCEYVHREMARALGRVPGAELSVTMLESPLGWARYEAPL